MKQYLRRLSLLAAAFLCLTVLTLPVLAAPTEELGAETSSTESAAVGTPSNAGTAGYPIVSETGVPEQSSDEEDAGKSAAQPTGPREEAGPSDSPAVTRNMLTIAVILLAAAASTLGILLYRTRAELNQLRARVETLSRQTPVPDPMPEPEPLATTDNQSQIRISSAVTAPSFFAEGTTGFFAGQQIPIRGQLGFGRDTSCEICYPGEAGGISKVHCALIPEKDGVVLVDLGSTCGTYLSNGERLKPHHRYLLHHGDAFFLCNPDQSFRIK